MTTQEEVSSRTTEDLTTWLELVQQEIENLNRLRSQGSYLFKQPKLDDCTTREEMIIVELKSRGIEAELSPFTLAQAPQLKLVQP